jgi:hypothetical protein
LQYNEFVRANFYLGKCDIDPNKGFFMETMAQIHQILILPFPDPNHQV